MGVSLSLSGSTYTAFQFRLLLTFIWALNSPGQHMERALDVPGIHMEDTFLEGKQHPNTVVQKLFRNPGRKSIKRHTAYTEGAEENWREEFTKQTRRRSRKYQTTPRANMGST